MTRKWLLAFLILIIVVATIIPLSLYYYHAHSVNNAPLINSILELPGSDLPISVTYTHNHIRENVTVFKNGEYYCILVSFTNLGNKSILLHATNMFKPNSTVGVFSQEPFEVNIINLENNRSYSPCPMGWILTPAIIPKNFTFYPGESIWFLERISYVCPVVRNFGAFPAYSHLVALTPGEYEVVVKSFLTNSTVRIPLYVNNIIGFYLSYQDGKMYAILPQGVCKIEICNIQINFTRVCDYKYEIDNAQQLTFRFQCLTNHCHFFSLNSKIWVNGQEYNVTIYSTSYLPSIC